MSHDMTEEEKEEKFKALFERARKGVLQYLDQKGGALPLSDLHDYSLKTYFIQHQRFSQLMETLVSEQWIDYDHASQVATLQDKGRKFIGK